MYNCGIHLFASVYMSIIKAMHSNLKMYFGIFLRTMYELVMYTAEDTRVERLSDVSKKTIPVILWVSELLR